MRTANKITTELTMSDAEWSASAINALLPERKPPRPLMIARNKFATIPIQVARYICFVWFFKCNLHLYLSIPYPNSMMSCESRATLLAILNMPKEAQEFCLKETY